MFFGLLVFLDVKMMYMGEEGGMVGRELGDVVGESLLKKFWEIGII